MFKKTLHRTLKSPLFWSAVAVLVSFFLYCRMNIAASGVQWTDGKALTNNIELPFSSENPPATDFSISFILKKDIFTPSWVNIIPDDGVVSLSVNGSNADLAGTKGLFDWNNGFIFPIGKYLASGGNTVDITLRNNGGKYGLYLSPSVRDAGYLALNIILAVSVLFFAYFILGKTGMDRKWKLLLVAGLAVRIVYLMATPWSMRGHDATGHLDYIEYIVKNHALPSAGEGFMFYHPPLYYIAASMVYSFARWLSVPAYSLNGILQAFSLALSFGYLFVVLRILETAAGKIASGAAKAKKSAVGLLKRMGAWFRGPDIVLWLAAALFVFWPSNVIHSVRIGNDALQVLWYALGLRFAMKWFDREGGAQDGTALYLSAVFIALGVLTKTNTVVLIPLIGILILTRFLSEKNKKDLLKEYAVRTGVVSFIILVGLAAAFTPGVARNIAGAKQNIFVANSGGLNGGLYVGNSVSNYIVFDARQFVTVPFTSPWDNDRGRQNFWNYLMKTSLFGEFSFDSAFLNGLGMLISLLFLMMCVYVAGGFILMDKTELFRGLPLFLNLVFLTAAAVAFRISIPAAPSNDFRYILPALVSFCYYFGYSYTVYRKKNWSKLVATGPALAFLFVALNILFFLGLFGYHISR